MARRCFLACLTLIWSLVAGQSPQYELRRGKVLLKPIIPGQPDGILWTHNGSVVVEFNGKEQQVHSTYNDRITLNWVTADLQITDLRPEDSGDYELDVDVAKKLYRSSYKLEVIDKVTKPTISCKLNNSKSSAELECSSEPRQSQFLMRFEWRTRGNMQPGPNLKIPLGDEHDDEVYSCVVSNPLSTETTTFTAKDCYAEKSSSVALIAGLVSVFAVVLLLLVGLSIYYCKLRQKACFAKHDEEKQSPPKTEGSDDNGENKHLLGRDRETTLPSNQRLPKLNPAHDMDEEAEEELMDSCTGDVKSKVKRYEMKTQGITANHTDKHKRSASPSSSLPSKSPPPLPLNKPASNGGSDVGADQHREPAEEDVKQNNPSESSDEPEPVGVSDELREDGQSDVEDSITHEKNRQ